MPTWNMFSEEVQLERKRVRDYGVFKIENRPGMRSTSYKGQALRELAKRLELEVMYAGLQATNNELLDRLEELELKLDLVKSTK